MIVGAGGEVVGEICNVVEEVILVGEEVAMILRVEVIMAEENAGNVDKRDHLTVIKGRKAGLMEEGKEGEEGMNMDVKMVPISVQEKMATLKLQISSSNNNSKNMRMLVKDNMVKGAMNMIRGIGDMVMMATMIGRLGITADTIMTSPIMIHRIMIRPIG